MLKGSLGGRMEKESLHPGGTVGMRVWSLEENERYVSNKKKKKTNKTYYSSECLRKAFLRFDCSCIENPCHLLPLRFDYLEYVVHALWNSCRRFLVVIGNGAVEDLFPTDSQTAVAKSSVAIVPMNMFQALKESRSTEALHNGRSELVATDSCLVRIVRFVCSVWREANLDGIAWHKLSSSLQRTCLPWRLLARSRLGQPRAEGRCRCPFQLMQTLRSIDHFPTAVSPSLS